MGHEGLVGQAPDGAGRGEGRRAVRGRHGRRDCGRQRGRPAADIRSEDGHGTRRCHWT